MEAFTEAAMAFGPMDEQARDEAPATPQAPPDDAAALTEVPTVELVPDDEPTPEQLEIKRLRDQLAQLSGNKDVDLEFEQLQSPGAQGNIVIHFLEDGLTALGQVWYRGQELEFEPGSRAHRDTFNRRGESWLSLAGRDFDQVEKWGKVMFRPGPWPGKNYTDGEFEPMRADSGDTRVKQPSPEDLERADKMRLKQRSAPRLPEQV